MVKRLPPSVGCFKFNIDGYFKVYPGLSGRVGVLIDSNGQLVFAFACHFGIASSLQAEAKALVFKI